MFLYCVSSPWGLTYVLPSVDVMYIQKQQEEAESDAGRYGTAQQEGITALTVDHLQEDSHWSSSSGIDSTFALILPKSFS